MINVWGARKERYNDPSSSGRQQVRRLIERFRFGGGRGRRRIGRGGGNVFARSGQFLAMVASTRTNRGICANGSGGHTGRFLASDRGCRGRFGDIMVMLFRRSYRRCRRGR